MTDNGCFEPDRDHVRWRELDGDVVLIDLDTAQIKLLEGSAAILWRALTGGANEDTLAECLQREYEIDPDTARSDVRSFLQDLCNASYVRPSAAEGGHS